jgi:hypothetical protein
MLRYPQVFRATLRSDSRIASLGALFRRFELNAVRAPGGLLHIPTSIRRRYECHTRSVSRIRLGERKVGQ